jgi:hypothetical protein
VSSKNKFSQCTRAGCYKNKGGDVDNSNLGGVKDMDVSYYCDLNLSTYFEPNSFEEATSHYEWKYAMQKKYDDLIKNGM